MFFPLEGKGPARARRPLLGRAPLQAHSLLRPLALALLRQPTEVLEPSGGSAGHASSQPFRGSSPLLLRLSTTGHGGPEGPKGNGINKAPFPDQQFCSMQVTFNFFYLKQMQAH